MENADIGLIGLGVMGSNLALNIAEKGNRIAVFNRTPSRTDAFVESAGALRDRIVPCHSIAELAAAIRPPRPIIVLVQAGKPVDEQIALLRPVLSERDIVIDAGNANFRDTMRRFARAFRQRPHLHRHGHFRRRGGRAPRAVDHGRRHPRILCRVESILTAIAAKYEGEPCCAWLGEGGAGHFVKTIHNGIEYADMQMIAEIYGVLRDGLGMQPKAIGEVFGDWNKGRLNSYLIEITAEVLAADDPADRQAGRRDHPRPRRPEGHGPLVGDRGADARRAGDRDRGGGRRAHPVGDEERARRRREGLWRAPAASRSKAVSTGCAPISSWRCLPARSPPMRKASPS